MKNFYLINNLKRVFLFTLMSVILICCKKEYANYPYADLLQFTIKDANGGDLKAVIKGEDIILYWPPMQQLPDSISPSITVSDRATILPASGKKVAFKDGVSYSITAQDGTVKKYKVKLAINQIKPTIAISNTASVGTSFSIGGDSFIPDTINTRIFLIDGKGKEMKMNNIFSIDPLNIWVYLPELEAGNYRVKMVTGVHTVIAPEPLAITYTTTPLIDNGLVKYPVAIKRGAEYNYRITGTPVSKITKFQLRLLSDNSLYELDIKSRNSDNTLTLKIPSSMPLGTYIGFEISSTILATPYGRNLSASYRIVLSE